tara:strand:- start:2968 stop:3219 length:252 start_codon:yes stop_codon:yes gene_type:complete
MKLKDILKEAPKYKIDLNDLEHAYYAIGDEVADMAAHIEAVRNNPEGMRWEADTLGKGELQKEIKLFKTIEKLFNKSKLGKVL